jgi:hypothetical protein
MRPGYTVLLEWGWLPYLDNNGNLVPNFPVNLNTSVLEGTQTMEQVFTELFNRSKILHGNYDALFGKVSNYNWSARPDGGYDCQTTLISIGEVIESLKVNSVPIDVGNIVEKKGTFGFKLKKQEKLTPQILRDAYSLNKLNGLLTELKAFATDQLEQIEATQTVNALKSYAGFAEKESIKYDLFAMRVAAIKEGTSTDNIPDSIIKTYITLESFVNLLNKYVLLAVAKGDTNENYQPLAKISVSSNPSLYASPNSSNVQLSPRSVTIPFNVRTPSLGSTSFDIPVTSSVSGNSLLCLAHPYQVSADIDTCVISNDIWSKTSQVAVGTTAPAPSSNANSKLTNINPSVYASKSGVIANSVKIFSNPSVQTPNYLSGSNTQQVTKDIYKKAALDLYKAFTDGIPSFENTSIAGQSFGVLINQLFSNPTSSTNLTQFVISDTSNNTILFDDPSGTRAKTFTQYQEFATALNGISSAVTDYNNVKKQLDSGIKVAVTGHLKLINNATDPSAKDTSSKFKKFHLPGTDELGIVGNIYISIDMVQRLINSNNAGSDKREIQLYSFLKTIMSKVQESIGNVNNFDIHVDPADGNTGRIIDINLTIPKNQRKNLGNSAFEIKVGTVGPNEGSIVRSYSLQSQIFPNQSSLIAIGSQVKNGGEQGTQNYTLLSFNRGITDRNLPAKVDPKTVDKIPTEEEKRQTLLQPSVDALNSYLFPTQAQSRIDRNGVENVSETNKYKNALRDIIAYAQGIYKSPTRNSNIIPIQLSLTTDGIGGMIIGNIFKISENVLPKGYKFEAGSNSVLAQTVVGLSHKIENNDWTTTIDAYNIILDSNEDYQYPRQPNETNDAAAATAGGVASTVGNRIIPGPFAPNGLRYPFDGRFPTPTGFRQNRGTYTHGGLDIAIGRGTTIYAIDDGKVIGASTGFEGVDTPAGGTQVVISHSTGILAGLSTLYCHLTSRTVNIGDNVTKGQVLGVSGNTGSSTGPHLHLEIRDYRLGKSNINSILDPGDYLPAFKR